MKSRKNWRPLLKRFFASIRSTASSKYVKLSNFAGEVGDSCIISNGRGNNSTDVHVNYYRVQYVHLQLPHTVRTPKMGDVLEDAVLEHVLHPLTHGLDLFRTYRMLHGIFVPFY